jgi:glycosyltransferase involved in cell wall biosynthesis
MQRLRVGFLSSFNYFDRNAWSGTLYSMHQALIATDLEIINLGNPSQPSRWKNILNRLTRRNAPAKPGSREEIAEYKKFTAGVKKQLSQNPCDVIFAPLLDAELNYLETELPIVKLSDATFPLLRKEYQFSFSPQEIEWISKNEAQAIAKASKLVYSSDWAANSAIDEYQVAPDKIAVIPFGPNFDNAPLASEILGHKSMSRCKLLFVGREWERKGGDIAFRTLVSLRELGIDAELVIVGTVPPDKFQHDQVKVIPFLNKNDPAQRQQFYELFLQSNFLIFPTRADCSPMVIGESNAFGLPVITSDVGGIPTLVRDGKNGYMLPYAASAEDYAKTIASVFGDRTRYQDLVRSSRAEYDTRLNWKKWAESLQNVLTSVVAETTVSRQKQIAVGALSK